MCTPISAKIDDIHQGKYEDAIYFLCYGSDVEKEIVKEILHASTHNPEFKVDSTYKGLVNYFKSGALVNCPSLTAACKFRIFKDANPSIDDILHYKEIDEFTKLAYLVERTGWVERFIESDAYTPIQNFTCRVIRTISSSKYYNLRDIINQMVEYKSKWEGTLYLKAHNRFRAIYKLIHYYEGFLKKPVPRELIFELKQVIDELNVISSKREMDLIVLKYYALIGNKKEVFRIQKDRFKRAPNVAGYYDIVGVLLNTGNLIQAREMIIKYYDSFFKETKNFTSSLHFSVYGRFLLASSKVFDQINQDYFNELERHKSCISRRKYCMYKPAEINKECIFCCERIDDNESMTTRCVNCYTFLGHVDCNSKCMGTCPLCRR